MIFKFKSLRYLLVYPAMIYSCILEASIIRVSKSLNTKSVTSAIRNANSGDTILVSPGNYFEKNIIIDKPLTLIGENYPVLDGEHTYELISIKSDHVIVKGFKLQHSGMGTLDDVAGIKIYDSEYVTIENNIFDDTFLGFMYSSEKNVSSRIIALLLIAQKNSKSVMVYTVGSQIVYRSSETRLPGIEMEYTLSLLPIPSFLKETFVMVCILCFPMMMLIYLTSSAEMEREWR